MSDGEETGAKMTPLARGAVGVLIVACAVVTALEFVIHRHAYFETEGRPLFFAIYGFAAFLIVVGGGVLLRKLVMRAPDYYDAGEDGDA
ncbi:MAG: hypothetical protein CBC43_008965 [Rhizobiales bacterium TMED83]|jgi:hypothetical protein|nr:hypothetical protein [Rhodobiaceae bacterium]RPF91642.1 MAG: hypothetical protein CBC43_008965 [Rhizobiales bacterium TMED83]|tara:strand:- start:578 stop:844 length:267 start_codon:yes stop_codon:yes gene_type:complete